MSIAKDKKLCYTIDAIKEEVQSNGQIKTANTTRRFGPMGM